MTKTDKPTSPALKSLCERLGAWRRRHGGRGRRIPDVFWVEAADIARLEDVTETARVLGINADRLRDLVDSAHVEPKPAMFVELKTGSEAEVGGSPLEVVLDGADGERMRMTGLSLEDVVRVASVFLRRV